MSHIPIRSAPAARLESIAQTLEQGNGTYSAALLRQALPLAAHINRGDVDLLIRQEDALTLARFAIDLCRDAGCHVRWHATRDAKRQLILFSADGQDSLVIDLWIRLSQFDGSRACLTFDRVEPLLDRCRSVGRPAICPLPADIAVSLYLHHLVCKRRDLSTPAVQSRLQWFARSLRHDGETALAEMLEQLCSTQQISPEILQEGLQQIQQRVGPLDIRRVGMWVERLRSIWLRPFSRPVAVCLIGCDGTGKTSLSEAVAATGHSFDETWVGKKLYRRSLVYQIGLGAVRRLTGNTRERLDELFSLPIFLRAAIALRWQLLKRRLRRHSSAVMIDRSLIDCLITDRKTDRPRWVWHAGLRRWLGERIPTVHLLVPHDVLRKRKAEMTELGHPCWDALMIDAHIARVPTDYVAFSNVMPLEQAVAALNAVAGQWFPVRSASSAQSAEVDRATVEARTAEPSGIRREAA